MSANSSAFHMQSFYITSSYILGIVSLVHILRHSNGEDGWSQKISRLGNVIGTICPPMCYFDKIEYTKFNRSMPQLLFHCVTSILLVKLMAWDVITFCIVGRNDAAI